MFFRPSVLRGRALLHLQTLPAKSESFLKKGSALLHHTPLFAMLKKGGMCMKKTDFAASLLRWTAYVLFGLAFVVMVLILNAKRWFDPWNLFWEITIWMYAALLLLVVLGILSYGLSELLRRLEE